ncbi:MAG TPA: pyridoxamine 5'-phosphate oxidase family protein [Dehalococcoidia bacterium]
MTEATSFAEIQPEFMARVSRIVWCTVATVDRKGRPRARILHPIWEGATGWIATGRQSLKAKHIASTPFVSLSYWDPKHEQVYADCAAAWEDDIDEKRRLWDLYKSTPPPLGYDLALFWKSPDDPALGMLKLTPWRIELSALADLPAGRPPLVWRPDQA